MKARQCDRCGKFYPEDTALLMDGREYNGFTLHNARNSMQNKRFDLCDDCLNMISAFIFNKNISLLLNKDGIYEPVTTIRVDETKEESK